MPVHVTGRDAAAVRGDEDDQKTVVQAGQAVQLAGRAAPQQQVLGHEARSGVCLSHKQSR